MRLFFLAILVFFSSVAGFAQSIPRDSSVIDQRYFSASSLSEYRGDRNFQYERSFVQQPSAWDRFWEWFWDKFGRLYSTEGGEKLINTIFILLAAGVLIFFVYRLTGMNRTGLFGRKGTAGIDYSTEEENIHTINFEESLQKAIDDGNYRMAVRLLYLQSLKHLSDRELINWQINKTNIAYMQELAGSPYQQDFDKLTLQFENNWYGDLPITVTEFTGVRELFNRFNRQLV